MTNWIMAVFTVVIAIFTYLVWKVYQKIAWLTGAMESHSEINLRLLAKAQNVKVINWDPTIELPPSTKEHGKEAILETIYVYLPLKQRKHKPSWWARFCGHP